METPAQQSTAFSILPPPQPAQAAGAPAAPAGDAAAGVDDRAKKILQAISQLSQRRQMSNTAVPAAIPGTVDPMAAQHIGMNTANPHAWSMQRFAGGVAANVKNAVAKQKQDQLLKAEGDWAYLQSGMSELDAAQASGDQNAIKNAQAKIDAVLGDPKKLKNMAKALNQDWLNPEKTTVYGEALKNVTAKTQQTETAKNKARDGLMGIFKKLMGKNQQPSLTPEQQQKMAREIQAKAPMTPAGGTSTDVKNEAAALADIAAAQKDMRTNPDKWTVRTIKDDKGGEKLVATDNSNPTRPYVEIKSATGEVAKKGEKTYVDDGKLEVVGGIPTGRVRRGGKWIAPGSPDYTKEDQAAVNKGLDVQALSEKQKERLASIRGSSYAQERARYTVVPVVDNATSESTYASPLEILQNPGKYVQPGEAEKISARESAHKSITANFAALDKSLDKLPNGLDTETQATIIAALKSENEDPKILSGLLVNKVKQNAPDEVIRYLTDMKAMQEDILVLRNVGGMGQGSDMMRQAMIHLIPGPGTSSTREAKMQIEAAKRTAESLFKGRPTAKFTGNNGGDNKNVIVVTPEDMK